jgi:hypothetical protein
MDLSYPETIERRPSAIGIEQADCDLFTVNCWQSGNTEVYQSGIMLYLVTAIVRFLFVRNIDVRAHFDVCDQTAVFRQIAFMVVLPYAVTPNPD